MEIWGQMKIPNAVCMHIVGAVEVSKSHPLTTWDIDETWVIGTFPVGGLCKCDIWSLSRGTFRPVLKCQGIRQILPCNQAFFASIQIIQLGWLESVQKQSDIMIQSAKPGRSPIIHSFGGLGITVPLASNSLVVSNLDLFNGGSPDKFTHCNTAAVP